MKKWFWALMVLLILCGITPKAMAKENLTTDKTSKTPLVATKRISFAQQAGPEEILRKIKRLVRRILRRLRPLVLNVTYQLKKKLRRLLRSLRSDVPPPRTSPRRPIYRHQMPLPKGGPPTKARSHKLHKSENKIAPLPKARAYPQKSYRRHKDRPPIKTRSRKIPLVLKGLRHKDRPPIKTRSPKIPLILKGLQKTKSKVMRIEK